MGGEGIQGFRLGIRYALATSMMNNTFKNQSICKCCDEEEVGPDFSLYCNECGYSMDLHESDDADMDDGHQDYDNEFNDIRAVNGGAL